MECFFDTQGNRVRIEPGDKFFYRKNGTIGFLKSNGLQVRREGGDDKYFIGPLMNNVASVRMAQLVADLLGMELGTKEESDSQITFTLIKRPTARRK